MCSRSVAGRFDGQRSSCRTGADRQHVVPAASPAPTAKPVSTRTIAETYGHRYEVAGGGGYLRFQSGAPQRNNEVTFFMTGTYFLNPKLGIIGDIRGALRKSQDRQHGLHNRRLPARLPGLQSADLRVSVPRRRRLPPLREGKDRRHSHRRGRSRAWQVRRCRQSASLSRARRLAIPDQAGLQRGSQH